MPTDWSWYAGIRNENEYTLACDMPSREAAIIEGLKSAVDGEEIQIIEARQSTAAKYDGDDIIPFTHTRNLEFIGKKGEGGLGDGVPDATLSPRQRAMLVESGPDDLTGREGAGVELCNGADWAVAKALERKGYGYCGGSMIGRGMYWNRAKGLEMRALLIALRLVPAERRAPQVRQPSPPLDLLGGQTIWGDLTFLREVSGVHGRSAAGNNHVSRVGEFRCTCGRLHLVRLNSVKRGRTTCCDHCSIRKRRAAHHA